MATIRGNDGSVTMGGNTVVKVASFEVTVDRQLLEDTGMGDTGRTYKGGFVNWTGRMACRLDPSDTTGQKALIDHIIATAEQAALAFVFKDDTDTTWTGNGIGTRLNLRQEIDGIVAIDFDLQGVGALAFAPGA